jgi:hypothetical protein
MEDQCDVAACRRIAMRVPIRLGTKRKMFSFVCSSSTFMGCFGVPLLWLVTRCSAAMLAEVESSLVECDRRIERRATSSVQKADTRVNYRVGVAESVAVISLCLVIRVEAEITKCGVAQQSAGVCFRWWVASGMLFREIDLDSATIEA